MHDFLGTGFSLASFLTNSSCQVFKNADKYPQFFDLYLNDEDRVIKVLKNDIHANERVFYYQYMKLCFEAEDKDSHMLVQNIRDLIFNPEFYFVFNPSQPDFDQEIDTDSQYKRLVFEFMEVVEEKKHRLDTLLKRYLIMDKVLVAMLRSLLIFYGQAESIEDPVDREAAFSTFQEIFGLELKKYESCIKFVDSDVFVYEENPDEVYMAYIQEDYEEQNQDSFVYKNSESDSLSLGKEFETNNILKPEPPAKVQKKNQIYVSNTSSVYDFVDFTSPEFAGVARTKDPLYFAEKETTAFFQKQKGLQMSATLGRPFQQPADRKLAASAIDQAAVQENPQKTLQSFQPRLQESIDMGYRIEEIKNRIIKEKETVMDKELNQEQQNNEKLKTKPSEASLAQNTSKASLDYDYFSKFEEKQIDVEPEQKDNLSFEKLQEKEKYQEPAIVQPSKPIQISNDQQEIGNKNTHNKSLKMEQFYKPPITSFNNYHSVIKNPIFSTSNVTSEKYKFDQTNILTVKQKIKLNVTKEFSNSAILEKLPQKSRQTIIMAKQRARAYRKSIQHLF